MTDNEKAWLQLRRRFNCRSCQHASGLDTDGRLGCKRKGLLEMHPVTGKCINWVKAACLLPS